MVAWKVWGFRVCRFCFKLRAKLRVEEPWGFEFRCIRLILGLCGLRRA